MTIFSTELTLSSLQIIWTTFAIIDFLCLYLVIRSPWLAAERDEVMEQVNALQEEFKASPSSEWPFSDGRLG